MQGSRVEEWQGRWDHQLGGPPPQGDCPFPCWDCKFMVSATPSCVMPMTCEPHCVACNYPDAVIDRCETCESMTWHDDGRCLAHEETDT